MAFDFKKTTDLVIGGLTRPQETWASYLGENPGWQQTLVVLTGPMVVANVVLSLLLSRIMGTMSPFGLTGNWFGALVLSLVMAAVGIAISSLVFCFLSGVFGGKPNFSRSFAAISLAAIPAWVATVVGAAIPWIGGLIGLAGAIVTLVFLYKIIPLALEVPEGKRVLHFVVSLVAVLVINMIIATVLGVGRMDQVSSGSLNNDEMEVVRSGGGNWAEYEWVRMQLRDDRMQGAKDPMHWPTTSGCSSG